MLAAIYKKEPTNTNALPYQCIGEKAFWKYRTLKMRLKNFRTVVAKVAVKVPMAAVT